MTDTAEDRRGGVAEQLTQRENPPAWWAILQISALAFHLPLSLLTGAQRAVASPSSVAAVGVGVSASFLVAYVLLKQFISGWKALGVVSAGAVLFWHSSDVASFWLVNVAFAGLVLVAAARFAEQRLFKLLTFVASMTLAATLIALMLFDSADTPDPIVEVTDPVGSVDLASTPDIYLILLDGYARSDVLETRYDFDNSEFLDHLRDEGFDVASASNTNYTITHLSLPSLLNMSYLNQPNDYMTNSDLVALARMTSGDNSFVSILRESGYEYVHGDSDHWLNTCGPNVDVCLPGPLLDITGHTLLATTPIGDFFYPSSGDPTTALNRIRIEQMANWSEARPDTASPTFTFLHLMLPHPPLFLDSTCAVRVDDELRGRILNDGVIDATHLQKRKDAWIEQLECANQAVADFLGQVDEDDVIIVTSDHGPDADFVIETSNPDDLIQHALEERLPNLAAVRMPEGCRGELPDDVHTVNLLRSVLSCLSGSDIPVLENRYHAASFGGYIVDLKYSDPAAD